MSDKKITILLIDDEVDLVDAVSFQLKAKTDYEVIPAYNGIEGLERLNEVTPDLIILDMNMPKMGGIEFYRKICDSKAKAKYPVLILTARANLEHLFRDLNVDGFMTKPFELDDLFKEIDTIITKRYGKPEREKLKAKEGPVKVLIVEDRKESFDKIAIAFLNAGYIVNSANSGMSAIDKIMVDLPDLLVIKLGLSDIAGDLVASKLKQMPKTMDIGIVLYTPHSEELNYLVTERICAAIGIRRLLESDDPSGLLREAKIVLQDK
ncbi:MAG: response regulator [Candidatus Omnitrophota bacterium]